MNKGSHIDLNKIYYINKGVDLNDFLPYMAADKLENNDLENDTIKKIILIGSIRLAGNLKELIKAAEILKDHTIIKFLIYGYGHDRESLNKLL